MSIWTSRPTYVGPADYTADQADLKAAYDRGRHDERAMRHNHPIIATAVVVLAMIGAWMLFLAAREGSFTAAGPVADQNIATAAQEAKPAAQEAVAETGQALKDAGATIKDKSESIVQSQKR